MPNYNKKAKGKIASDPSLKLSSIKDSLRNVNNSKAVKYIKRQAERKASEKEVSDKFSEFSSRGKSEGNLRDVNDPVPLQEKSSEAAKKIAKYFKAHSKRKDERAKIHINPKKLLWILVVLLLILIILSTVSEKVRKPFKTAADIAVVPIQKGVNSIGLWISDKIDERKTLNELIEENEQLKEQISELTLTVSTLTQDNQELERLRELMNMKNRYSGYPMVGAHIVAKESGKWYSTFTLDVGTNDGIQKDMNVIAHGGLVGIVTDVGNNFCTVRSIIDDDNSVSAQFEENSQLCIINGSVSLMEKNLLEFTNVSADVYIPMNGAVVTSNISSKYLPGILIGYVTDYKLDKNDLTQSGYIKPIVDFSDLEEVLVITKLKEISD